MRLGNHSIKQHVLEIGILGILLMSSFLAFRLLAVLLKLLQELAVIRPNNLLLRLGFGSLLHEGIQINFSDIIIQMKKRNKLVMFCNVRTGARRILEFRDVYLSD